MFSLFWRQFKALFWKNWIVLSKHSFLNLIRCFILPVAYGIFLATAQLFLNKPNNLGIGQPIPVLALQSQFKDGLALLWADATDGTSSPRPTEIISRITGSFTKEQFKNVKQVSNASDIPFQCPQNFNFFSECFAAVIFYDIPPNGSRNRPVNYTIRADAGLSFIDVERHTSHYEQRILPLQWAIDKAIIDLQTNTDQRTPLEWPYTKETNEEQSTNIRLSYIRGLRSLLVLALFICYIGIVYQLPGSYAGERANGLTAHMKAMGLLDLARIMSWHISISLIYLPAWVIVSIVWRYRIFSATNTGLIFVVHLLLGLTLASWSLFVGAFFGKSPQLAAVVSTFLSILFAIFALVFKNAKDGSAFIFTLLFPPGFYIFASRAICGWENHLMPTNTLRGDPDNDLRLLPLIIAAIIDVFLWPAVAVLVERCLYDTGRTMRSFSWRSQKQDHTGNITMENVAISVRNLRKTFKSSILSSKNSIVAIDELSFDVPKRGIFVLLGSNGAGKSTALSILGGLASSSGGAVTFEGGVPSPPRGAIGIVPQKNVLFPDLSCIQNLRVWRAVKWSNNSERNEDLQQLLRDCDIGSKADANANTLSGGQKRKLQLAIGLAGGSKIVLVDECTSGVDPLSRRALWRTLTTVRETRTIVFTTHFLDEADLLADHIAILAAPGKLIAQGSPISLKHDFGKGYSIQVAFAMTAKDSDTREGLYQQIRSRAPSTHATSVSPQHVQYHLDTRDIQVVASILRFLDKHKSVYHIDSYDVLGTSIEDVFLNLMDKQESVTNDTEESFVTDSEKPQPVMQLSQGRSIPAFRQALTILHKRFLIARRSWLTPVLAILVAIAGSTISLVFIKDGAQTCTRILRNSTSISLYLPASPIIPFTFGPSSRALQSPPGIISTLGDTTSRIRVTDISDNVTFVNTISTQYRNLSVGGISLNLDNGESLVAWEASPPGLMGPSLLNLATNVLYNRALNVSGHEDNTPTLIRASFEPFPAPSARSLSALKWVAFYGAAMSVFPAFFALYVSKERRSSVQAMQLSNGLTNPIGLWLGHLMFDTICTIILSTIIIIIIAAVTNQFHGLGFFWLILVLYGITGALFAYCVSLVVASPLAAFATVAGYQIIMFVLYLAGYLLVLTYGKTTQANNMISIIHWTLSIASPVASVVSANFDKIVHDFMDEQMRAALVSVNLFSLLCDGTTVVTASSLGQLKRFGGPILYLIVYSFILLALLFGADSGSILPRNKFKVNTDTEVSPDVNTEAEAMTNSSDLLRVMHVSKRFHGNTVVDNVSFGVSRDTIFAMLGPNGAGKTTTFNVIRGDVTPNTGDVLIAGTSVVRHPRVARLSLGVCPQFTAIDAQLTVREHLMVYGRLKGLAKGSELDENVNTVLRGTALHMYADRLASKLSGGNQRKLSLAIALIGNPSVVLIDEFSTGIDAKMKRDMWNTLRNVALGKAVIITTHSMEEASALANRVGILAKRMLAIGSTESLSARYAMYEVHFNCPTREELVKFQTLMSRIPGSRLADDVATRFEIPIDSSLSSEAGKLSLAQLFEALTTDAEDSNDNRSRVEFTVGRATLESVFLKVIRDNNVKEEDQVTRRRWWRSCV
ncbi:hypothetical protein AMATHDRAFT_4551 [Amanita thiersii Skay4041]|uniref:ABC transporter domain-containing protein n=1 Tax=Amanita thiersii Skay4041 TaxID=703135 RepID=A0A2A9NPV5_9AGAR|nr:hypothetical protein AMATHDRAFT_4551 [Amanita thiersii Skay4041]